MIARSSATAMPVAPAVVERPVQVAGGWVEQVEDGALAPDETRRELDDLLEDLAGVAQRRDARRDLAQGLLCLGPPRQRAARAVQLVDEAGPADGDGRLRGDRLEQPGIAVGPGV